MGTVNRRAELLRSLKFTLFSASAGLIQIGAFALCNDVIHLPAWLGYLIALVLSVLWNFTLNRRYTFRSAASVPRAMALVALSTSSLRPAPPGWSTGSPTCSSGTTTLSRRSTWC